MTLVGRLPTPLRSPPMLRACRRRINSLPRTPANYTPLTPLHWLERSARTYGDAEAIRYSRSELSQSWLQTRDRAVALADALRRAVRAAAGARQRRAVVSGSRALDREPHQQGGAELGGVGGVERRPRLVLAPRRARGDLVERRDDRRDRAERARGDAARGHGRVASRAEKAAAGV